MPRTEPSNRIDWSHAQLRYNPDVGPWGWTLSVRFAGYLPARSRTQLLDRLADEISTAGFASVEIPDGEAGAASVMLLTFETSQFLDVDPAAFKAALTENVDEVLDALDAERSEESDRVHRWIEGLGSRQILPLEADMPGRRRSTDAG